MMVAGGPVIEQVTFSILRVCAQVDAWRIFQGCRNRCLIPNDQWDAVNLQHMHKTNVFSAPDDRQDSGCEVDGCFVR